MDFASRLRREYQAEWKESYLKFDHLIASADAKSLPNERSHVREREPLLTSEAFETFFRNEIDRVEGFYDGKMQQVVDQHSILEEQYCYLEKAAALDKHNTRSIYSEIWRWLGRLVRTGPLPADVTACKEDLELATYLTFRKSRLLRHFATFNLQGFTYVAALKGGHLESPEAQRLLGVLKSRNFANQRQLDEYEERLVILYANHSQSGDRLDALRDLYPKDRTTKGHFNLYRAGFFAGIGSCLISHGIHQSLKPSVQNRIPEWASLLQIWSALFIPVALFMLLVIDLAVWKGRKINYILIFKLDRRNYLGNLVFGEIPAAIFFLLASCFWLTWRKEMEPLIMPTTFPLVFICLLLGWCLLPLPILHPSARWWAIRSISRTISAGTIPIQFRDFWLGDMLTSVYYSFSQAGFFICAYRHAWDGSISSQCSPNDSLVTPCLAIIPFVIRSLQSLRRYKDLNNILHLGNAAKGCISIGYQLAYYSWRRHGSPRTSSFSVWLCIAIINTIASGLWDILIDWDLWPYFSRRSKRQHERLYPTWSFPLAILANTILRCAWLIYLLPFPSDPIKSFLNALLEVVRRLIWNMYRLESEQLGNSDSYQAVADIEFPYPVHQLDLG